MPLPTDGYYASGVYYNFQTNSPSQVHFTLTFPVSTTPEWEVMADAVQVGIDAMIDHFNTVEPTWEASYTKSFHGIKDL